MTMQLFRTLHSGERKLDNVQLGAREAIRNIATKPILDGVLIEDVALLASATTLINHRLGRAHRGWSLQGLDADARVWEDTASSTDSQIALKTSADCTVNLWVF